MQRFAADKVCEVLYYEAASFRNAFHETILKSWTKTSLDSAALDEILRRDALVVHHAADGFGQHTRNGNLLYLLAGTVVGDAVGKYHF